MLKTYLIYILILTTILLCYYVVVVTLDLHHKPEDATGDGELRLMVDEEEERPVEVSEDDFRRKYNLDAAPSSSAAPKSSVSADPAKEMKEKFVNSLPNTPPAYPHAEEEYDAEDMTEELVSSMPRNNNGIMVNN